MPHSDRVDGVVSSSKPLSYGGTLIENFRLEFVDGTRREGRRPPRVQEVLRELVASDEGAACLGEIALVPHGSPISQSGLLFYNTLFDENAASHVALGSAYKFTMAHGRGDDRRGVRGRGRQPQRHPRRLHDRLRRPRHRRCAGRRLEGAGDARRRMDCVTGSARLYVATGAGPRRPSPACRAFSNPASVRRASSQRAATVAIDLPLPSDSTVWNPSVR